MKPDLERMDSLYAECLKRRPDFNIEMVSEYSLRASWTFNGANYVVTAPSTRLMELLLTCHRSILASDANEADRVKPV